MTEPSDIDGPRAWRRLALALCAGLIGNAGMWVIVLILPAVETEFGLDRAGSSIAYTLTMLGYAVGNVVLGGVVDRFGLRAALTGASLLIAGAFVAASQAAGIGALAAVQFLLGLGAGVAFGPLIADISHWFRLRRGIAVAVVASGNYAAGAVWPLILAPVLAGPGWRTALVGLAAITILTLPVLAWLLRAGPPGRAHAGTAAFRPQTDLSPNLVTAALCLAGVACCVAMAMPQVHIVALCVDAGFGAVVGGQMLALMLAGGVVSRLTFGMIADRLGGLRAALIGAALQGLSLVLYLFSDGLTSLYIVSLVFGLSQGGIVPSYALVVREYLPPAQAGARVGLVMMGTIIGMALGGWLTGEIHDRTGSYDAAFLNGIGWNLLNLTVLTLLLRATSRRRPQTA
jgi:MFS family permease